MIGPFMCFFQQSNLVLLLFLPLALLFGDLVEGIDDGR